MEQDKEKSKLPPRIVRYQKMLINVKGPLVIFDKQKPQPQTFDLTKLDTRAALHKFLTGTHSLGELADLTVGLMDLVRIQQAKIKALGVE
jgi:hypothetical protein